MYQLYCRAKQQEIQLKERTYGAPSLKTTLRDPSPPAVAFEHDKRLSHVSWINILWTVKDSLDKLGIGWETSFINLEFSTLT